MAQRPDLPDDDEAAREREEMRAAVRKYWGEEPPPLTPDMQRAVALASKLGQPPSDTRKAKPGKSGG
jgi:hypothetical protein